MLTAEWEDRLMQVEAGTLALEVFEREPSTWLSELIARLKSVARRAPQRPGTPHARPDSTVPCPTCGKPMRQRTSSRGPFWGCSGFPACNHTQPDEGGKPGVRPADLQGKTTLQDLPGPARQSAKPPPATAAVPVPAVAGSPCPSCAGGRLIGRAMKGPGRRILGCTGFPACRHFQRLPQQQSTPP